MERMQKNGNLGTGTNMSNNPTSEYLSKGIEMFVKGIETFVKAIPELPCW